MIMKAIRILKVKKSMMKAIMKMMLRILKRKIEKHPLTRII